MKIPSLFPVGAMLVPAFLASLASRSAAQQRTASDLVAPSPTTADSSRAIVTTPAWATREEPWTSVLYDEPGDGCLWAVGASWKASFGADGVVYLPRVGANEPRNRPLALSPDLVTLGGEPVEFERAAQPARHGDRVTLDRGSFTEAYDLSADSVEQSFVFESLPRAGDLVLRIPVGSDLAAFETSSGLEFRSEHGRVDYSRAVAIDARGRRTEAETRIEDGAITIRIGADVLADAALPLVVDPLLAAIFPDFTLNDTFSLDAAFDPFQAVWVVVYERVFSATDHDVIAKMYGSTGSLIATASIDVTSNSWITPRIADLASAHKFLVVAGTTAATGGAKSVRGRIAQPNGTLLTLDLQFSISGSLQGACIAPDVGGDSRLDVPGTWCVVFERDLTSSDHTIMYGLISSAGTPAFGPTTLSLVVGFSDEVPTISKGNGGVAWTVAWERFSFSTQTQIQGARISPIGALIAGPFFIGGGINSFASGPCASSPLDGGQRTAVVFQSGIPVLAGGSTSVVALLDGSTVLQVADLQNLEPSTTGENQIEPSVDSDGQHFLVSYSEFDSTFAHYKLFVTDLAVSAGTLQAVQSHLELQPGIGLSQTRSNVAAARTTGALAHRYLTVYDYRQNDVDHDAAGRFIDGVLGGPTSLFCFGDGTGAACPCANSGAPTHGCANSVFAAGALLQLAAGQASTLADTAVLQVSSVPPGVACIFFQGTASGDPVVLGDGLFCTAGSGIRLGAKTASPAGVASYPEPGDLAVSVRGAVPEGGGLRTYQVWYRNAATFCTSATFNVSNGLAIQWAR
jgi:hypothetical protein